MKKILTTCAIAACLVVSRADAQAPQTNAALRYWMAFALMKDPTADKDTAELLERVADGAAAWDEGRLGRILDDNREALDTMLRATALPVCDWGLEYELGPRTPIAHLARARALGRLGVLAGLRLSAKGQTGAAIDTWLGSVRFSQDVASGGSLIALLSGRRVLTPALRALDRTVSTVQLDGATRTKIESVIRALPDSGFNWSAAMRREAASVDVTLARLSASPNPGAYYASLMGLPAPPPGFSVPTTVDVAAFHKFMEDYEGALALPYTAARVKLAEVERRRSTLHPVLQRSVASVVTGFGDNEIPSRRKSLLDALARTRP